MLKIEKAIETTRKCLDDAQKELIETEDKFANYHLEHNICELNYNLNEQIKLYDSWKIDIDRTILEFFNKFMGNSVTRLDNNDILQDKYTAKKNTIFMIDYIYNTKTDKDYYEIMYWEMCLDIATKMEIIY